MGYIETNKEAWEEAFENRAPDWGTDIVRRVASERYAFFMPEMAEALAAYDFKNKALGQFCCNNGRELLSLVKTAGARSGVGFDIAENQVAFANEKATELGLPCTFVATNILDIGKGYYNRFDAIIITIGALCWFKDLGEFFDKIAACLAPGGALIIHEQHPVTNMLSAPGEDDCDKARPTLLCHSYFSKEWIGNDGMYYITKRSYTSKTFTDYTHPLAEIMGAILGAGLAIRAFREHDNDISGMFGHLSGKGIPLSYIIEAKKA